MGPTGCLETSVTNSPVNAAQYPRRAKASHAARRKPAITSAVCLVLVERGFGRTFRTVTLGTGQDVQIGHCSSGGLKKELVRSSFSRGYYRSRLRLNQICNTYVYNHFSRNFLPAFLQIWSDCWTIFGCVMHSDRHTAEQGRIVLKKACGVMLRFWSGCNKDVSVVCMLMYQG
jgi:hypothetical protein